MKYRVDLSGMLRVQTTVEVEASSEDEARERATDQAINLNTFVWEADWESEVGDIDVDQIESLDELED